MNQPERVAPSYYVEVEGRAWGPYPLDRLQAFAEEGRVTAQTPVASSVGGPFAPAFTLGLPGLFPPAPQPIDLDTRSLASRGREPDLVESQPSAPTLGPPRPLVIFAGLQVLSDEGLEAALAAYGPYQRVRPGLWLIRARLGASALRNALSRRLRNGDTLLVVEAPLEQAAWFNLDQAQERTLRQLWAG